MIKDKAYYNSLSELIIGCAFKVNNELGSGFLEKVYENAFSIELVEHGLSVETQKPIKVFYKTHLVGEYIADILVDEAIILELKAIRKMEQIHFAQCQNYLKATGLKLGLVINFGNERVQVKRLVNGL